MQFSVGNKFLTYKVIKYLRWNHCDKLNKKITEG